MAAARAAGAEDASGIDPARLVLIDESGFDTRLMRTHARAPRGQRAHGTAPAGPWQRLTLIGAMAHDGLCAARTVADAADTAAFHAFVTQALVPALLRERPDAIVAMGNLAAHKAACVREALGQAGIGCRCLPAGPEPHRTRLGQAQDIPARHRLLAIRLRSRQRRSRRRGSPVSPGPRTRHPRRPQNHNPQRRSRLASPRRLHSEPTRNLL